MTFLAHPSKLLTRPAIPEGKAARLKEKASKRIRSFINTLIGSNLP